MKSAIEQREDDVVNAFVDSLIALPIRRIHYFLLDDCNGDGRLEMTFAERHPDKYRELRDYHEELCYRGTTP
jgi:hypothetical protein